MFRLNKTKQGLLKQGFQAAPVYMQDFLVWLKTSQLVLNQYSKVMKLTPSLAR